MAGEIMPIVIRAEGLGKKYIYRPRDRARALYGACVTSPRGQARNLCETGGRMRRAAAHIVRGEATEEFWALKDVSFEVKRGEVLGIIGRNGAGKIDAAEDPVAHHRADRGARHYRGRVASLLEVGTGFHPELTGRENIYLNGAILGMTPCRDSTQSSTRSSHLPRWRGSSTRRSSATQWHVCPARLRGRGASGARDLGRRRGAGGRGCGVSKKMPWQDV